MLLAFVTACYAVLLGAWYGRWQLVWFAIKMVAFPLYAPLKVLWVMATIIYAIGSALNLTRKVFRHPIAPLAITLGNVALWVAVRMERGWPVGRVEQYLGVVLGTASVIWLYDWTRRPFETVSWLLGWLEKYTSDQLKATQPTWEKLKASLGDGQPSEQQRIEKHNENVTNLVRLPEAISRWLSAQGTAGLLVTAFSMLYVLFVGQAVLDFATSYWLMSTMDPLSFVAAVGADFLDYLLLSLRTMLLNDYARLIPHTFQARLLVMVQSIMGVVAVVLLINSLSLASSESAKSQMEPRLDDLTDRVRRLRNLEVPTQELDRHDPNKCGGPSGQEAPPSGG
ncbi:MAG TPA: hypothetical protein PKW05_07025 [Anaerolineae bacterium]|nr:hypothetical protein [Anaerolineae bacterium]HQJ51513.1 hypothetical protein [Anaerolineae bacterium]